MDYSRVRKELFEQKSPMWELSEICRYIKNGYKFELLNVQQHISFQNYTIRCSVGFLRAVEYGRSMKIAKTKAAVMMLNLLYLHLTTRVKTAFLKKHESIKFAKEARMPQYSMDLAPWTICTQYKKTYTVLDGVKDIAKSNQIVYQYSIVLRDISTWRRFYTVGLRLGNKSFLAERASVWQATLAVAATALILTDYPIPFDKYEELTLAVSQYASKDRFIQSYIEHPRPQLYCH